MKAVSELSSTAFVAALRTTFMKDSRTGEPRSVSQRIKDTTSLAAEQAKNVSANVADKTFSALAEGSGAVSRKVADAASSCRLSAYAVSGKAAEMTIAAVGGVQTRFKKALGATVPIAAKLSVTTQGLLASSLSDDLNGWLQGIAKGSATIYDKAMMPPGWREAVRGDRWTCPADCRPCASRLLRQASAVEDTVWAESRPSIVWSCSSLQL